MRPNYAFKRIAGQALRPNQTIVPQPLNAALALIGGTVRHRFILVLTTILMTGCGVASLDRFASPEEQAAARSYIELLRSNRFDELGESIDPSIKGESLVETLKEMSALIPEGEPTSVTMVGAQKSQVNGISELNLTFEYEFPGVWLLINVATRTKGSVKTIYGFNVVPQTASVAEQNSFSLSGKTALHYSVMLLGAFSLMVSLYSLVVCLRTKIKCRKWPWIAFIAVGVGSFSLNWSTGQWWFAPLSVQLFSVSAFAPYNGPWTIAISLPLGALVFLLMRRKLMRHDAES